MKFPKAPSGSSYIKPLVTVVTDGDQLYRYKTVTSIGTVSFNSILSDTAAAWTTSDYTLDLAQIGYETDTGFWKWGDGSTAWTSLTYDHSFGNDITVTNDATVTATTTTRKLIVDSAGANNSTTESNISFGGTAMISAVGDIKFSIDSGNAETSSVYKWVMNNPYDIAGDSDNLMLLSQTGVLSLYGYPDGSGGLNITDTSPIYLGSSNQGRLQYSTDHLLLQQDTGTDPLTIVNTQQGKLGRLQARNGANTATKTCLTWGGANPGVTLTHDGTDVLDTSSTGVTVNGALAVDDISVTDNANSGTEILVNNSDSGTSAYAGFGAIAESARVDVDAFSTTYTPVTAWQDAGVVSTTGATSGGLHLNAQAGGVTMSYTSTPVVKIDSTGLGFFNTTPVAQPDITGSASGNAALQNLLTALANLGLITDSST